MSEAKADIGLIGLAVMGQNLILNMNDHGFTVAAFNRTVSKVDDFLANEAKGTKIIGTKSIEELMGCLKKPRRVVLLVKAGQAVDDFIEQILPHTEEGDIIIDGGEGARAHAARRAPHAAHPGWPFRAGAALGRAAPRPLARPRVPLLIPPTHTPTPIHPPRQLPL